MNDATIEKAMKNAEFSLNMEGLSVDDQSNLLCKKLLKVEITYKQYLNWVKSKVGLL